MAHVRIKGLAAGDTQHHDAQQEKSPDTVILEKIDAVEGIYRGQNLGALQDRLEAEPGDDGKPDNHDGTEKFADPAGAMSLRPKEQQEYAAGEGQNHRFGLGGGNFEALQGGEDGNDRGDQAVAVEQGGAEEPGQDQPAAQVGPHAFVEQGQHGEDAAFPLIIGPEDEQGIFHTDHQGQRPKNQGNQAQDIGRRRFDGGMAGKTDFKGI